MEALTLYNISQVAKQLPVRLYLDPTTTAYLQYVLTPLAQAVDQITTLEDMHVWYTRTFTAKFAEEAQYWIEEGPAQLRLPTADGITNARKAILDFLIDSTLYLATDKATDSGSKVVLPWDLQAGIVGDLDSRTIFGITGSQLPVTVRIGGRDFEHVLSLDFVAGLQDYYRYAGDYYQYAGDHIEVFLFGTLLTAYYLFDESRYDAHRANNAILPTVPYRVMYDTGADRAFKTMDYIRGATTAALWRNEDPHTRMRDLRYIDAQGQTHPLTF